MDWNGDSGWLYDGVSAIRQPVALSADGPSLILRFEDGRTEAIDGAELSAAGQRPGMLLFRHSRRDGWQLALASPPSAAIAALLPEGSDYGRWIDRIGLWRALGAGLVVSLAVLTAAYFLPHWAAPLVPESWERRYGEALVGNFGGKFCFGAGGQKALDALAAKLSPNARDLDIRVVDVPIANAAALPGGHIVLFRELVSQADGPDQVAGVLAHEIAHVENRHVTETLIRRMGFGIVVASLGGTTGGNIDALLATRYSREAEREADLDALKSLARANISPRPTADFFARLAEQERKLGDLGTALAYVSTHPLSAERQNLFADAAEPGAAYEPALDRGQWEALADICHNEPAGN